ncbi:MAG: helicase-associated domain-containing protein, partial [Chloroflexi bacterium]|nr:helicase-associated domain-containing protein [Chloroflexota bacterium]
AVEEIIAFLDHESSTPMPQNVRLTLQEWGRYHERIVFFRGVSLCQVADPSVLDHLLADSSCKALLDHRISPTAALIGDSKRLRDLVKALQSKGFLPTVTSPLDKQPSSLTLEPDGHIRFRHRVPDFHLLHQLTPFTEMREAGPLISKKSVSKAVNAGWTAERIIETMRLLCGKPPPPEMVSKIKVWGRYYGDAAMKKVTLLQLKNAEVLQELSKDPEVGPLIVPFSPPGALAIVRDEDVETLRQALMKKGMDLNAKFRLLE